MGSQSQAIDLAAPLIQQINPPSVTRVGVLDLESSIRRRIGLAGDEPE